MDDVAVRLLELIRSGQAVSRAQLVQESGFARGTVSSHLDRLIDVGLVASDAFVRDTGGRPAERLIINPNRGILLGADIGGSHTRVGIMDLGGEILQIRDHDLDVNQGPEAVLGLVYDEFEALLAAHSRAADDVMGIAIGIPGPVEHTTGTVVQPPTMSGWDGFVVPRFSRTRFAAPVAVDKDANLLALGEYRALEGAVRDVLVLKVGMGIGAGIIANGQIVRGGQGAAGDLGHLPRRGGAPCRCGQEGCAEATAGGWAIARALREAGVADVHTSQAVIDLADQKEPMVLDLLRSAGDRLGEILADVVGFLNPSRVIIAGNLASSSEVLLAGIRRRVYEDSHPLATKSLVISTAQLGNIGGLAGAAQLAGDVAFGSGAVQALASAS
ncbi:MAG TPA: ROK family transcriptional regulator [Propionicimonas sp.]|nr:ROK family transcriptional regulator [Propionicimonas sp.]